MKIFLDTAETDVIRKNFATGLVDGLTTNPTLIMKSGRNPEEVYEEIRDIGVLDVSMEVVGTGEEMVAEGRRLQEKFGDITTIKVPCTRGGLAACRISMRSSFLRSEVARRTIFSPFFWSGRQVAATSRSL